MLKDSYRHKGMRRQLIEGLRAKGIGNESILEAMMNCPRHFFLDKAFEDWAYKDKAFPIECEQTISQPYTVAFQTSLLEVKPNEKVLEIGTGSGYQAVVLKLLGARVFTIERHKRLFEQTKKLLHLMGHDDIRLYHGDGYLGLPMMEPFDKILLTAGADTIPEELIRQLKPNGKMVIPLGNQDVQKMIKITKNGDGSISQEGYGDFVFVPFLQGVSDQ